MQRSVCSAPDSILIASTSRHILLVGWCIGRLCHGESNRSSRSCVGRGRLKTEDRRVRLVSSLSLLATGEAPIYIVDFPNKGHFGQVGAPDNLNYHSRRLLWHLDYLFGLSAQPDHRVRVRLCCFTNVGEGVWHGK